MPSSLRAAAFAPVLAVVLPAVITSVAVAADPASLAGTRWQLVRIIGLDDQFTVPDEATRYTIDFDANGRASLRADCSRVLTTWSSPGAGRVQFGPLAATRAACGPTSLAAQMLRDLPAVRSYSIRDGHLYLAALDEKAPLWEFEPLRE
jgi:heat shock protein HslJ